MHQWLPNTSNFHKNTPLGVVLSSALFPVFAYPDDILSLAFDILYQRKGCTADSLITGCSALSFMAGPTLLATEIRARSVSRKPCKAILYLKTESCKRRKLCNHKL